MLVPGAGGRTSSVVGDGTNEFTVTVPGTDAEGNDGGADVVAPAGGSVTIDGQKYSATDGELTLHVDEDGTVSVKEGTVELSDSASVAYGETVFTNPADSGNDEVVVTVSDDGAELTVPNGTGTAVAVKQSNGERTYTNGGTGELKLHSDTEDNITLEEGTVTIPDGGEVKAGDDGCTVTGAGVDVTKGGESAKDTVTAGSGESFTVEVPAKGETENGGTYSYKNAGDDDLVVELVDDNNLPLLKEGTAGLPKDSAIGLTGGGRVKNTGDGEVTDVTASADGKVTVPADGSAEINGVKVSAAADGEGTAVAEEVKFDATSGSGEIKVEKGQSIVLNGVTYTGEGEDGGTITIDKDGNISFDEGISRTIKAGESTHGVKLGVGDVITIEHADGTTSTLTGKAENTELGVIYSETADGDIEMHSGEVAIKGKAEADRADGVAEDAASWYYVGQPEITVRAEDGQPVSGAVVTFTYTEDGTEVTLTATTDENGVATRFKKAGTDEVVDLPYGPYEYEVDSNGVKVKGTIHINATDVKREITVELVNVSAKVGGDAPVKPSSDDLTGAITGGDISDAISSGETGTQKEIEITLNANKSTDTEVENKLNEASGAVENSIFQEKINGDEEVRTIVDRVDVTIEKKVYEVKADGERGEQLGKTDTITSTPQLITLRFPISADMVKLLTEAGIEENQEQYLFVYREHEGTVTEMRKVSPEYGPRSTVECYYIETLDGSEGTCYIVIRANRFSVYGFGLSNKPIDASDPQPGGTASYKVTVPETAGGKVVADRTRTGAGQKVTLTVTTGFLQRLKSLKVVDRNGDEVEYTDNADGTITFKMPRSNVEVVAEFEHFCPSLEFPNLDVTQWYHEATDYVIWFDVMNGHDTGLFAPEGYATRAEMVTVLWNQVGREEVDFDLGYTDVEAGEWYYEAIQWATSVGVINGYADGSFRPNQAISREEMAAMLYRFEQELGQGGVGSDGELKFADAGDVSDWAFDAVLWCAKKEIILGEDDNMFNPADKAERDELAAILMRYMELEAEEK